MIYDGFKMGDEYWRIRVDDLHKDKENVWVGSLLQQTCWPHTLIPSELWPLLRNSATDLTGRAPINDLGGIEVILSTDTVVVLCTSVDHEYLIVKLHSSPTNSSTEICEVKKFRGTPFISDKSIFSFSEYYHFKLSAGNVWFLVLCIIWDNNFF